MLNIVKLSKVFASQDSYITALNNISFSLNPGDKAILYGLNGSGKTTLLKCIFGLLAPENGYSTYINKTLNFKNIISRKRISFIASTINTLYPRLTIRENLIFFTFPYIGDLDKTHKEIDRFMHLFHITQFDSLQFQNCSSGIKK